MVNLIEKLDPQRIVALSKDISKIPVTRRSITRFADMSCDMNKLHRDRESAKAAGFKDTPATGAQVHAMGIQYAEGVRDLIEEITEEKYPFLEISDATFSQCVYPARRSKKKPRWSVGDCIVEGEKIVIKINTAQHNLDCLSMKATFVQQRNSAVFPEPPNSLVNPITSIVSITQQEVRQYERLLRAKNEYIHEGLTVAHVPSALMEVLHTRIDNTLMPRNRSMYTTYYGQPQIGDFEVELRAIKTKEVRGMHISEFETRMSQDNKPILLSRLVAFSDRKIDLNKLSAQVTPVP